MITDADALPLLLEVMAAAGEHDADRCLALLERADSSLTPRRPGARHKARADIAAARDAVASADWRLVHSLAWSATTQLTSAFPPDPSTCPPVPGPAPFSQVSTRHCACGHSTTPNARFCSACGAPVAR